MSAYDIGEAQPGKQFVGGGVRQIERLMGPRAPVVGLERVDRIYPELGRAAGVALDTGVSGDQILFFRIVWGEAD